MNLIEYLLAITSLTKIIKEKRLAKVFTQILHFGFIVNKSNIDQVLKINYILNNSIFVEYIYLEAICNPTHQQNNML